MCRHCLSFPRTTASRCSIAPCDAISVSIFSLFQRIHTRNRQCEHKLLRTMVGKQFWDADKKTRSIRNYKCRIARHAVRRSVLRWFLQIFFLIILSFPEYFFFLFFLRQFYVNRPWSYLSPFPAPPTPLPCSAFYGPQTGPIFLSRQSLLYPPLVRESSAVLFLIYICRVRHPFSSPLARRFSLSLFLS